MLSHETNTFSNVPTDRAQFEARGLHYGGEILEVYRGTGTCLGGMIAAAERLGATLRGETRMPPPLDQELVDVWGQTRDEWHANRRRLVPPNGSA